MACMVVELRVRKGLLVVYQELQGHQGHRVYLGDQVYRGYLVGQEDQEDSSLRIEDLERDLLHHSQIDGQYDLMAFQGYSSCD